MRKTEEGRAGRSLVQVLLRSAGAVCAGAACGGALSQRGGAQQELVRWKVEKIKEMKEFGARIGKRGAYVSGTNRGPCAGVSIVRLQVGLDAAEGWGTQEEYERRVAKAIELLETTPRQEEPALFVQVTVGLPAGTDGGAAEHAKGAGEGARVSVEEMMRHLVQQLVGRGVLGVGGEEKRAEEGETRGAGRRSHTVEFLVVGDYPAVGAADAIVCATQEAGASGVRVRVVNSGKAVCSEEMGAFYDGMREPGAEKQAGRGAGRGREAGELLGTVYYCTAVVKLSGSSREGRAVCEVEFEHIPEWLMDENDFIMCDLSLSLVGLDAPAVKKVKVALWPKQRRANKRDFSFPVEEEQEVACILWIPVYLDREKQMEIGEIEVTSNLGVDEVLVVASAEGRAGKVGSLKHLAGAQLLRGRARVEGSAREQLDRAAEEALGVTCCVVVGRLVVRDIPLLKSLVIEDTPMLRVRAVVLQKDVSEVCRNSAHFDGELRSVLSRIAFRESVTAGIDVRAYLKAARERCPGVAEEKVLRDLRRWGVISEEEMRQPGLLQEGEGLRTLSATREEMDGRRETPSAAE